MATNLFQLLSMSIKIVKFNSSMIETTSEIISTNELPFQLRLGESEIQSELEKVEKVVFLDQIGPHEVDKVEKVVFSRLFSNKNETFFD